MTPKEEKLQNKKIRLMRLALILGGIWGLIVLYLLLDISKDWRGSEVDLNRDGVVNIVDWSIFDGKFAQESE